VVPNITAGLRKGPFCIRLYVAGRRYGIACDRRAFLGLRGILGDEKNGRDPTGFTGMDPIGFTAESAMTPTTVLFRPMPPEKVCTAQGLEHWNVDTV